ncbi:uncharacterized protein LOC134825536 [Bolinopsis microptera]|uniref:uncharacterized protein LOC134825536 n=1 Tax=Bolinopsis microptera TaxID=2820187 RepID=UPI00307B04D6
MPSTDPTELIGNIIKNMDMWTMRSAHLKVRLIRVRSKENNEGEEEEAATLKLITDAVVCTLGHLLTEIARGGCKNATLWLLPTFINKLHDQVKEHLIKWLGKFVKTGRGPDFNPGL